ncbi:MAG: TaqI-like C-terminal specificity domain-containing protein [Bacteroidales bacterium]|nr:TaqI-like C-terminal specificity domain-containing protein [Bacteroidales bacterium]
MSFEKAHSEIKILVENFKANENFYISKEYQEAEVRKDFIDKFFVALGWDVLHHTQTNPYEQEVKVERGVNVSGAQKKADYSFSLAPNYRDPKFFTEAKKPSKDLYNSDYYFQTVRYGWHKTTPLAVLTDFEEFHILDCRFSPDISTILHRKIKQYHYSEYVDSDKFAEIYWLFSREAVINNSLEKFAENLPKPKGKAYQKALFAYEKHLTIDDAFLEEIDGIREILAKAFKKNDDKLDSEELTEATQRTIDRLVFIRFLEDKLIEQVHYVNTFGENGKAWDDFIALCIKLDAKYNGIVFKKCFIDDSSFKGPVDSEFHDICQNICHLNSRFLYNEIPIHILGSIYERFLGKVVHATNKRVTVEEKPAVRKAGGVFYTPKNIVDYIVQNTVGKQIEGKDPERISKLRFADIACGSGSFLIGVFEYLLDYYNKYYQLHPEKAKKDKCLYKDGIWVLSIKQKQNILRNNIYGVDIDNQAVEVTQLSLSLKMLEDETTATANEMQVLFHEKILPDMSKNIICGNSLIEQDILTQNLFAGEEERKLNPMDFISVFPEVMRNGGFDSIVGNPPYVVVKGGRYTEFEESKYVIDYYKSKFKCLQQQINIYVAFIEKAYKVCKQDGLVGLIIPNTILTNDYSVDIRKYLLDNTSLVVLNNVGQVFKGAVVEALVIILLNRKSKSFITTTVYQNNINHLKQNIFLRTYLYRFLLHLTPEIIEITDKCDINSVQLNEITEVWRGLTTGNDEKYLSTKKLSNNHKKIIQGKQINRYYIEENELYVNYLTKELDRSRPQYIFETEEKIISKFIGKGLEFAYDTRKLYVINTGCVILLKENNDYNAKYVLGILNSKLLRFYFSNLFTDYRDIFPIIKSGHLERLPIKQINFQNKIDKTLHDKIVQLVEQMLKAKNKLNTVKIDKDKTYYERRCYGLDQQIDNLVYELYGLIDNDIRIVEGR